MAHSLWLRAALACGHLWDRYVCGACGYVRAEATEAVVGWSGGRVVGWSGGRVVGSCLKSDFDQFDNFESFCVSNLSQIGHAFKHIFFVQDRMQ